MNKIIVAGHVCIDITPIFSPQTRGKSVETLLCPGKLLRMDGMDIHTGGVVANTGLALKCLNADVRLVGKIGGDDLGSMIRSGFARYDADDGLIEDPSSTTSYSVVLAMPGKDRLFLHDPGTNDTFCNADVPDAAFEDGVLLHFGYPPLMKRMYQQDGDEIKQLFLRAHQKGLATSLDLAAVDPVSEAGQIDWKKLLGNILPHTDFFLPSLEELLFMLDRPKYDTLAAVAGDMTEIADMERDVKPLAQAALDMGVGFVMIKCGLKGMYYATASCERLQRIGANLALDCKAWESRSGQQACFRADCVKSGTGAGDTSIAAFLAALVQGKAPDQCVRLAAAEGACCVTTYDVLSGLKTLEQLEEKIAGGWAEMES